MKKIILIILFLTSTCFAEDVTLHTTYSANGQVTATNLNGNFQSITSVVNGGLDNNNADTTSGYRFFEIRSSLPTVGTQGRVVFNTSDNTLNFDDGSAWQSAVVAASPVQGNVVYYNGTGWVVLAPGTSGQYLKTQGAAANPTWSNATATDLSITSQAQGDILYYNGSNWVRLAAGTSGQVLKTNGVGANPAWVTDNLISYKAAIGNVAGVGAGGTAVTGMSFSTSSSYRCVITHTDSGGTSADPYIVQNSNSQFTIYHTAAGTGDYNYICLGT